MKIDLYKGDAGSSLLLNTRAARFTHSKDCHKQRNIGSVGDGSVKSVMWQNNYRSKLITKFSLREYELIIDAFIS